MKALMRGFGLLLLCVIMVGLSGCGTDNETDAAKLQTSGGPPPPVPEGSTPTSTPKYSSREDYGKAYKNPYEGTKYGGATKKK